jgi:hypothetical protein
VHQTLHCALSDAPAARAQDLLFLCAVRCAPDRHCRLSGAPILRFKKRPPARNRARGSHFPLCSLALCPLAILPSSPTISSPAAILRRPSAPLLPSSLVSSPCFSPSLSLCFRGSHALQFHPCHKFQIHSKFCESPCLVVCLVLH